MAFDQIQHIAGGDIYPSRFVKLSTAADYTLLQAGANERVFGVATNATKDAPLSGASSLAAAATYPVATNPVGSIALVEVGSGGITRGDMVKSDSNGKAVTAASTGTTVQWIGGEALESAAAGEFAKILVVNYPFRPALS